MFLVSVYLTIIVLSGISLYTIGKYLIEKPFGAQFVTDYLFIDLTFAVFCAVSTTGIAVIGREISGPFNNLEIPIFSYVQQFLYLSISTHIISLQIAQFCNIFFTER